MPPSIDNNRVTDPFETKRTELPLCPARSGGSLGPSSERCDGGSRDSQSERCTVGSHEGLLESRITGCLVCADQNTWVLYIGKVYLFNHRRYPEPSSSDRRCQWSLQHRPPFMARALWNIGTDGERVARPTIPPAGQTASDQSSRSARWCRLIPSAMVPPR